MQHEDIAQYLSPEYPREIRSESSHGFQYRYLVDTTAMPNLILPLVGDYWDQDLDVTQIERTPRIGGSVYDLWEVSTVRAIASTGSSIGTNREATLKEERYQIRWLPQSLPLLKHPVLAGMDAANRAAVIGWENELSEENKANFRYAPRNANGDVTGSVVSITNPSSPAYKYVKLRLLGHENYVVFAPSWSKIGIYQGEDPPPKGNIGQKETPTGDVEPPPDWEWVKTDDSAERLGLAPRWQRTETWTGAKKVDYDIDEIF